MKRGFVIRSRLYSRLFTLFILLCGDVSMNVDDSNTFCVCVSVLLFLDSSLSPHPLILFDSFTMVAQIV